MLIRPYTPSDATSLLSLFRDTIRRVNARDYTPEQIRAWASDEIDPGHWAMRFEGRFVVVAILDGQPAGFAELESSGHIDRFYVAADHQRQGIGAALWSAIEKEARLHGYSRLFLEASLTARPFFESRGCRVIAPQVVTCRGEKFLNFRMERPLIESDAALA